MPVHTPPIDLSVPDRLVYPDTQAFPHRPACFKPQPSYTRLIDKLRTVYAAPTADPPIC